MKELNIIGRRNIFLAVSGVLLAVGLFGIFVFGFRLGIDFRGGTLWRFETGESLASSTVSAIGDVETFVRSNLKLEDAIISYEPSEDAFLVRLSVVDEPQHQEIIAAMQKQFSEFRELSFQSIGPSVGKELRTKALWGIVLVLVGISLYIAFAFRKVSRPIKSWKYGVITLITLFHDVIIPAGFLAFLGHYKGIEIDGNFVVALLVIMGFSVHDTIVVFDRIRENLSLDRGKAEFGTVINRSINQTLGRSINTSLTLIIVLVALYFVGPQNLAYFVLTLLIGVTLGTYSSVFVASPALLLINKSSAKR